jgi:hypothetical protein
MDLTSGTPAVDSRLFTDDSSQSESTDSSVIEGEHGVDYVGSAEDSSITIFCDLYLDNKSLGIKSKPASVNDLSQLKSSDNLYVMTALFQIA